MPDDLGTPAVAPGFLIGLFALAVAVGVAVIYLGISGHIGAGIP